MAHKKDKFEDYLKGRRQFQRYTSDLEIRINTEQKSLDPLHALIDVSLGGLAFTSSCELKINEIIWISIPANEPLFDGRAQVMWVKKVEGHCQIGVKFLGLDEAALNGLIKFLQFVKDKADQISIMTNPGNLI